ncbi:MAG TPA: DUF4188 domain-containing protein [Polyangiaceae bacterium]|nr:DUF4188 domain-containing protein [Polyangiaceae bacterium]
MKTHNERVTSNASPEPVVVFLIGMRVNRWWKVRQWLRTALAMPRMLRELAQHPELGMLGGESWFGRTTILVSYWKSADHLFAYAKQRDADHLPAWRAFNKHIGTNGDVGIWHETYAVQPGACESIYVNMPAFGLGKAIGVRAASHRPKLSTHSAAA